MMVVLLTGFGNVNGFIWVFWVINRLYIDIFRGFMVINRLY